MIRWPHQRNEITPQIRTKKSDLTTYLIRRSNKDFNLVQIGGGYRVKIQNRISMREPLLELMIEPIKHRDTETNMALIPCKLT